MARSSKEDPVEKFRFRVTVIAIDPSLDGALVSVAGIIPNLNPNPTIKSAAGLFGILSRSGFSEVMLPRVTISEINYRENLDSPRFVKIPGLAKYDPVILKRGVTKNRDLYDWYRLVNNEVSLLSASQELIKNEKFSAIQTINFRKDVIIEVLDREGTAIKGWYLFNAWPNSYKGGDDLNAASSDKLIEELSLTYEFFVELEGGALGLAKELLKGAVEVGFGLS
jgi:phage tail-like protein